MTVTLTVCTTCKYKPLQPFDENGKSGGMLLAEALEADVGNRSARPRVIRHECLWNCRNHCSVLIRATDKPGYLVGRFEGGPDAAAAILEWTDAYAASPEGKVPYREWPAGMKGHFILNIPVLAEEDQT
jgi:predicted metal-binding protein